MAEIEADGTITIKGAGEANITVRENGNEEYAPFEHTQKLTVKKKPVTVTSINPDEKTAVLEGVLTADVGGVSLDFNKINLEILEETEDTDKVNIKGLVLSGEAAANYELSTESIESTVKKENVVTVEVSVSGGNVTGGAKYLKGSSVTLTATPDSNYRFSGWYADDQVVSTDLTYTFTAEADCRLTVKFTRRSSGGGGTPSYAVNFETNGGSRITSKVAKRNTTISEPAAPTKEGDVFKGWFTDKELNTAYDFDTPITNTITLYAAWEKADLTKNQIILTIGRKDAKVFGETRSNDVAPIVKNDRTMLPARFVAESLGARVAWDGVNHKVTITKDDTVIVLTIGSDEALVNGETIILDSPAFVENDRTYTPIRFIAEKLGAAVDWNQDTKEVIITK